MSSRPCLEPRCPHVAAPKGGGRCQEHARKRGRAINRQGRAIYATAKWRNTRRAKLRMTPICEQCDQALATQVHHKHGVEHDPWGMDNLESLCASCHSSETRRRQVSNA